MQSSLCATLKDDVDEILIECRKCKIYEKRNKVYFMYYENTIQRQKNFLP